MNWCLLETENLLKWSNRGGKTSCFFIQRVKTRCPNY